LAKSTKDIVVVAVVGLLKLIDINKLAGIGVVNV
jgi:hypothetical protein